MCGQVRQRCVWLIVPPPPPPCQVLLRKLSNAIILRCAAVISLDDVFSGEVRALRAYVCVHACVCTCTRTRGDLAR